MKFVKENLFLVAVASVVVIGGGGMVMLTMSYAGTIEERLEDREDLSGEIRRLLGSEPVNEEVVETEARKVRAIRSEAASVAERAIRYNKRYEVLQVEQDGQTHNAFPYDEDRYRQQNLGYPITQQYIDRMDELKARLRPTVPPTEEEIERRIRTWEDTLTRQYRIEAAKARREESGDGAESDAPREYDRRRPAYGEEGYRGRGGYERGRESGRSRDVEANVEEEAREKGFKSAVLAQAARGWTYLSPTALTYVFERPMPNVNPQRLWQAQVKLWICSDIIRAIRKTDEQVFEAQRRNDPNFQPSVMNAAVKHLMQIDVDDTYFLGGEVQQTEAPAAAARSYGPGRGGYGEEGYREGRGAYEREGYRRTRRPSRERERDEEAEELRAATLTGRVSNEEYDVLQYRFTVVMPLRYLGRLEANLSEQNFHTILQEEILPLSEDDRGNEEGSPYYYGSDGVKRVTITAELPLLTAWERGTWQEEEEAWSSEYPPLLPKQVLSSQLRTVLRPEDEERLETSSR